MTVNELNETGDYTDEEFINELEENEKDRLLQMDMMFMTTSDECPRKLNYEISN